MKEINNIKFENYEVPEEVASRVFDVMTIQDSVITSVS